MITKIHFIVNPVAGSGRNYLSKEYLYDLFDRSLFEIEIKESLYPKHAIQLATQSVDENVHMVVACGGDGTINEVASCLVHTHIALGIIPMGSGNGLASNLNVPRKLTKALQILKNNNFIQIDVGQINSDLFFSNTGIGFDAHVISDFEKNTERKLFGYVRSVINTLRTYKSTSSFQLQYMDRKRTISPFMLFISNSNEMGYKMSLTPKASLQDGLLDIIIVPKLSLFKMTVFTGLFFLKKLNWLRGLELIKVDFLKLSNINKASVKIQIDGNSLELLDDEIEIKILPRALKVCVS